MKTREEIERRLRKLRVRYAHKYLRASQERRPSNCRHNEEYLPKPLKASKVPSEMEVAPRRQVTLVVLNEPKPIRICMYGADSGRWSGAVCDTDRVAAECPYFEPLSGPEAAKADFMASLADDQHVFDNYRDIATLQWVIGERVHSMRLKWWERLWLAVLSLFVRTQPRRLPGGPEVVVPDDLWSDPNDPPPAS